jgi:UDP-N-acetylmuramate dehydrogenase
LIIRDFNTRIDGIFVQYNSRQMSPVKENVSLLHLNTFQLDVKAKYLIELHDTDEISWYLGSDWAEIRPRLVLGGGSNILFTGNFDGLIIRPVMTGIEITGETGAEVWVRAGAGENWDNFVQYCVDKGYGGTENLSLIPGTVGASPVQNIGAYGVELKDIVESVDAVSLDDGKLISLNAAQCRFSYRDSIFKHELLDRMIITHVTFRLSKNHKLHTHYSDLEKELGNYPEISIATIREAIISIRRNKLPDPEILGNAGSFFKNPFISREQADSIRKHYPAMPGHAYADGTVKLPAAWLIEQCGWKGKKFGETGTYKRQPLILINYGNAGGDEILKCALKIQKSVMNNFAIRLEMEVNIL